MNKYHAKKTTVNGQKFDSRKEAQRAGDLMILEKIGEISNLRFQVPYILQGSFKRNGKIERAIIYIADAVYTKGLETIVEDTKSVFTAKNPVYRIKRKMFLFRYPDLIFNEYV